MTDKLYFKFAIGWTIFLLLLFLGFSSPPGETSGGEQMPLTRIAYFILAFIIGQVILLIVYFVRPKNNISEENEL